MESHTGRWTCWRRCCIGHVPSWGGRNQAHRPELQTANVHRCRSHTVKDLRERRAARSLQGLLSHFIGCVRLCMQIISFATAGLMIHGINSAIMALLSLFCCGSCIYMSWLNLTHFINDRFGFNVPFICPQVLSPFLLVAMWFTWTWTRSGRSLLLASLPSRTSLMAVWQREWPKRSPTLLKL